MVEAEWIVKILGRKLRETSPMVAKESEERGWECLGW